ncbi:ABC transporter permease [Daejeonella lutea]|uniref:Putative ABC transport system permease protein n=1 Tax=Daejeonella lutea TaxID=572036 RepID=A0A1T5BP40_9SPHI|nr:ABC transporter permease [Daejeonella lutea]SKB48643.1 putative ABC transport system permease protein [Daejeonella lutea]
MIKNYLKTAWRNLFSNKLYTLLNIAGLTFGITCFLLIGLYVFDELTFDQQHSKAKQIYRVVQHINTKGEASIIGSASHTLAEQSRSSIAEIENTTKIRFIGRDNLVNPQNPVNNQETIAMADERFLQVFDFPLLYGNKDAALKEPNSIVVDEELAKKLFNSTDVLGNTLVFNFLQEPLKITGVLKKLPANSSLRFNLLLSDATIKNEGPVDWLRNDYNVFTVLEEDTDASLVGTKLTKLVLDKIQPELGTSFSFSLQPLSDLHLKSSEIRDGARNSNVDPMPRGSLLYIKIFSFIAFFVLLIGGINYMNLTTARASNRLKEIGVRKVAGAMQGHLIRQFLIESLMLTFISFALAVIVLNLALPAFNTFTSKELSLGFSTDFKIWLYALAFTALTGILAGTYPAFLLARFKPVSLMKGLNLHSNKDVSLRKVLVVFQFTISTVMIFATIILYQQVQFLNQTNLGFDKDLLVVIDVNSGKARSNFEMVKNEMMKIPSVKSVSVSSRVPGEWKTFMNVKIKPRGSSDDHRIAFFVGADKDFTKTFGVHLLDGRTFDTVNDSASVILNETAAKMLGITRADEQLVEIPSAASGGLSYQAISDSNLPFEAKVIGIVKDFHFQSLRDKIEPLVLAYNQNPVQPIDYFTAKISSSDVKGSLSKLKEVMLNNDQQDPFEYNFLDDQIAKFYIEDHRRQTMIIWAALSSVFIACLGLFGLATFSAMQRVKEIGIRKVLGADVLGLAALLSKDFLKLVLIAICIGFPLAWWGANKWLQEYAYHIDVEWWMFAAAGFLAILTALLTTSFQAIKAALSSPVRNLRS